MQFTELLHMPEARCGRKGVSRYMSLNAHRFIKSKSYGTFHALTESLAIGNLLLIGWPSSLIAFQNTNVSGSLSRHSNIEPCPTAIEVSGCKPSISLSAKFSCAKKKKRDFLTPQEEQLYHEFSCKFHH